jgi:hypothetical protein
MRPIYGPSRLSCLIVLKEPLVLFDAMADTDITRKETKTSTTKHLAAMVEFVAICSNEKTFI